MAQEMDTVYSSPTPGFVPGYLVGSVLLIFSVFCFVILGFLSLFCVLCRILPVSLDCPFLFDPSVFSNVYLLLGGVVVVIVGFTTTYAINVYHH